MKPRTFSQKQLFKSKLLKEINFSAIYIFLKRISNMK